MNKFEFSTEWFVKVPKASKGAFYKGASVLAGMALPFKEDVLKKEWDKIKNLEKVGAYIYAK